MFLENEESDEVNVMIFIKPYIYDCMDNNLTDDLMNVKLNGKRISLFILLPNSRYTLMRF